MAHKADIQTIHDMDVEQARETIRSVCEHVSSCWVPRDAIADALLLEYVDQVRHTVLEDRAIHCLERTLAALKAGKSSKLLQ